MVGICSLGGCGNYSFYNQNPNAVQPVSEARPVNDKQNVKYTSPEEQRVIVDLSQEALAYLDRTEVNDVLDVNNPRRFGGLK